MVCRTPEASKRLDFISLNRNFTNLNDIFGIVSELSNRSSNNVYVRIRREIFELALKSIIDSYVIRVHSCNDLVSTFFDTSLKRSTKPLVGFELNYTNDIWKLRSKIINNRVKGIG